MTLSIIIDSLTVNGIPLRTFAPADARNAPLIFFNHGFFGSKDDAAEIGWRMASAGLFCTAIDAYRHGERLSAPLDNPAKASAEFLYPPDTGFDLYLTMIDCALHTARDIDALIEHFQADPRVDASRVGVTGFSMGGFASYFAAAQLAQISAAAPMGAYPELARRWGDFMIEAASYPQWTEAIDQLERENARRAEWLRGIDPAARLLAEYRKPLFILNGDIDTDAPKAYTVPFYGQMRALYASHPQDLRLRIVDGVAHHLTAEMMQAVTDWFVAVLGKPTP